MSNLPPGVAPADIDEHFGEPETRLVVGDVTVGLAVETPEYLDKSQMKTALIEAFESGDWEDIVDVRIHEVETQ